MPATPFRVRFDKGNNFSDPPSELAPGELVISRNSFYEPESGALRKWPGNTLFGAVGAAVTGLSFVRFRSGSSFLIASTASDYYTAPVGTTGSWTARTSAGLTSGGKGEAVYFKDTDLAYVSDGVNRLRVWSGSGAMRAGGLTRPSVGTLTFLSNSATTYPNTATFYYCHTEYDSTNDIESAPSNVAQASATAANGTFKYVFPTVTNGSTSHYKTYRTQHGGAVFYLIATVPVANLRYYDGDDTEALGSSYDNDNEWGFKTVDDAFLTTRATMPMIGEPLKANYITVNGTIPIGDITGTFDNSYYIAGVDSHPLDLYYSVAGQPETFPPINFVRPPVSQGDAINGAGIANDRLIVFTFNGVYRLNTFPRPTDPGFGLGLARFEEVTADHGCVAKRTVVPFGIGTSSSFLFYLSTRGPMITDGGQTWPINKDLAWDPALVNFSYISGAWARVFPKYQIIILAVPSKDSTTNDICFVYHYHPDRKKSDMTGPWTGPLHKRVGAMAASYDTDTESRLFVADTTSDGNVYLDDNGTTDAQLYDNADGKIDWEWETGDQHLTSESTLKRAQRVFVNMAGTDDTFAPEFYYAVNKKNSMNRIAIGNITSNTAALRKVGTSFITKSQTRTYRGGVWKAASHFRWKMRELAAAERSLAAMELEVENFGRQR